jgi:tetratricopeptide (TPR) repeat protein
MFDFTYTARDRDGRSVTGVVPALGLNAALARVKQEGLTPLSVVQVQHQATKAIPKSVAVAAVLIVGLGLSIAAWFLWGQSTTAPAPVQPSIDTAARNQDALRKREQPQARSTPAADAGGPKRTLSLAAAPEAVSTGKDVDVPQNGQRLPAADRPQSEGNAMASAKQYLAQGDWDSLVHFASALKGDPEHAMLATDLLRHAKYMQGHYDDSLESLSPGSGDPKLSSVYKQWASEDPDSVHIRIALGRAYVREVSLADALSAFGEAWRIDNNNPHVFTAIGVAKRHMGQTDEAIELHLKAIELDHKLGAAYVDLGFAYLSKERLTDAKRILQKGVEMCPGYAPIWSNLGLAHRRQGAFDEAIDCYQKALSIRPGNPVDYLNLGSAYTHKEQYAEAKLAWQKAAELDPNGPTGASAKRNLSLLP